MQREKKDQDQVQPPPYFEDGPQKGMEEALKFQENKYCTLLEEEGEEIYDEDLSP